LGSACAGPHPKRAETSRIAERRLLDEAEDELRAKHYPRARALFAAALASPEFSRLPSLEQHWAIQRAAYVAWKLGLAEEGLQYARRAFAMRGMDARDFYLRRDTGRLLGDRREGVIALTELARRDKVVLTTLGDSDVAAEIIDARAFPKPNVIYLELMQTLFDMGYRLRGGVPADRLWRELSALLLERDEASRAERVALRFSNGKSVITARADRRFDGIVAAHPLQFDWKNAAEQRVARLRNEAREKPRSLTVVYLLADALVDDGRPGEALAFASGAILTLDVARASNPYPDAKEMETWLRERRSNMFWALGRWEEAIDDLRRASELPEDGGKNASQNLALGDRYCALGRGREALAAARAGEEAGVSPHGEMVVESERAVASDILGDAGGREAALAYLRLHEADGPDALQEALERTGDLDGAARVLSARLSDPVQRLDALFALQDFTSGPHSPWGATWAARRNELLARPDVKAAVTRVGRIESYDLPAE
jgi:tetratricopeptide (TPR) repeat protein